jgi:hypothetical protein
MRLRLLYYGPPREPRRTMPFEDRGHQQMTSAYASWIGHTVVLQVDAAGIRVPLRGTIVGESDEALRFRVGESWDIDIFKPMVLAVEEDKWAKILI